MATHRTNDAQIHAQIDLPPSANDAAFAQANAPVRLLTLGEGATRVIRDNELTKRDELWRGEAHDHSITQGEVIAIYLRVGKPVPLVAELLCAVIARTLGLPAPEPFVVLIEPRILAESALLLPDQRHLCVGTRDIGGTTFGQLLNENSESARALLKSWEHLLPVTALDEWLANPDRNYGNILFTAQTLHIIDHAEAFGGSTRAMFPLADITHDAFTNKLADLLIGRDAGHRQGLLNIAREWVNFAAGSLDIGAAVASADIKRWQTAEEEAELVHFISTRLTITHRLLCQRLGHPQLALSA